jgi:hypothetical protein
MRTIADISREMTTTIDQRWGLSETNGLPGYLSRMLNDAIRERVWEMSVPEGEDEVGLLAGFLAAQHGLAPDDLAAWEFRSHATKIVNVLEATGISLSSLGTFYIPKEDIK